MEIEHVTAATSDQRLKQWHAAEVAAAGAEHGWPLPPMTHEELVGHAKHRGGGLVAHYEAALAVDDDEVVGFSHSWWLVGENSHLVDVSAHVLPERRREGIGRALLEDLIERARRDGRRSMTLPVPPGGPAAEFARALGAEPGLGERHSVLDIADVDWDAVTRDAVPAPGYRLAFWADEVPEPLLPSLARATESMDDAPKGTLDIAFATWTPEMVRASYELSAARGYRRFVVAAVEEASEQVVGFTEVTIPPGRDEYAEQNDTVVVPAHRGHRLGMAIKAAQLLRLRAEAPGLQRISTWNAEVNQWMLAVNIALGFRPAETWGMHQLTLR